MIAYALVFKLFPAPRIRSGAPDLRDEVDDVWEARVRCDSCDRSFVAVEMDFTVNGGQAACLSCADHGERLSPAQ